MKRNDPPKMPGRQPRSFACCFPSSAPGAPSFAPGAPPFDFPFLREDAGVPPFDLKVLYLSHPESFDLTVLCLSHPEYSSLNFFGESASIIWIESINFITARTDRCKIY